MLGVVLGNLSGGDIARCGTLKASNKPLHTTLLTFLPHWPASGFVGRCGGHINVACAADELELDATDATARAQVVQEAFNHLLMALRGVIAQVVNNNTHGTAEAAFNLMGTYGDLSPESAHASCNRSMSFAAR